MKIFELEIPSTKIVEPYDPTIIAQKEIEFEPVDFEDNWFQLNDQTPEDSDLVALKQQIDEIQPEIKDEDLGWRLEDAK